MQIHAAVLDEVGGPWHLRDVELDEPRAGEVLVRIVASGMCHTDLSVRDGYMPFPLPGVLGHEGAGVVERVGPTVTKVRPGDHVVLTYPYCGECPNCLQGRPTYCPRTQDWILSGTGAREASELRANGMTLGANFMGQSSFATHTVVPVNSVIKIREDVPLELLAPLGCGFQTGAGSVLRALQIPFGSSLAVFGTGSVGLAAVMAAAASGVGRIVAVDINADRLDLATTLGATDRVNPADGDPVQAILELTDGLGVEYSLWAIGLPEIIHQAVGCLTQTGTCGLLGIAPMGAKIDLEIHPLVMGRTIRGILAGDTVYEVLIPQLIELFAQGRFPFDRLVERYAFDQINQAAKDIENGRVVKPVLVMPS